MAWTLQFMVLRLVSCVFVSRSVCLYHCFVRLFDCLGVTVFAWHAVPLDEAWKIVCLRAWVLACSVARSFVLWIVVSVCWHDWFTDRMYVAFRSVVLRFPRLFMCALARSFMLDWTRCLFVRLAGCPFDDVCIHVHLELVFLLARCSVARLLDYCLLSCLLTCLVVEMILMTFWTPWSIFKRPFKMPPTNKGI